VNANDMISWKITFCDKVFCFFCMQDFLGLKEIDELNYGFVLQALYFHQQDSPLDIFI